jgi:hypothetical protein
MRYKEKRKEKLNFLKKEIMPLLICGNLKKENGKKLVKLLELEDLAGEFKLGEGIIREISISQQENMTMFSM